MSWPSCSKASSGRPAAQAPTTGPRSSSATTLRAGAGAGPGRGGRPRCATPRRRRGRRARSSGWRRTPLDQQPRQLGRGVRVGGEHQHPAAGRELAQHGVRVAADDADTTVGWPRRTSPSGPGPARPTRAPARCARRPRRAARSASSRSRRPAGRRRRGPRRPAPRGARAVPAGCRAAATARARGPTSRVSGQHRQVPRAAEDHVGGEQPPPARLRHAGPAVGADPDHGDQRLLGVGRHDAQTLSAGGHPGRVEEARECGVGRQRPPCPVQPHPGRPGPQPRTTAASLIGSCSHSVSRISSRSGSRREASASRTARTRSDRVDVRRSAAGSWSRARSSSAW